MAIKFILCTDRYGALGYNNQLLYHISNDLKRFKKLTEGHIVLMGRKTLESLPNQFLPHRINVVITRDKNYKPKNSSVTVVHDLDAIVNQYHSGEQDKDLFVIGGAELFNNFPVAPDVIHLTKVLDQAVQKDVSIDLRNVAPHNYYIDFKTETHIDEKDGWIYQFKDFVRWTHLDEYYEQQKNNPTD